MPVKPLRLYVDTSVFGGCFDDEFAEPSLRLFEQVRSGRFTLLVSQTALEELIDAPAEVRDVLTSMPEERLEVLDLSAEILALRDAYINHGVVGPDSLLDAEHIATATIARADILVSWNFKHIVQFERIRGYNDVNLKQGFAAIAIHSPWEVIE